MAAEELFMVRCDAPRCEAVLESDDRHAIFHSLEAAMQQAEASEWLVEHPRNDGLRKTYCPNHWHKVFGLGAPYWGRKERRRTS